MPFKKGHNIRLGKHLSEEHKKKLSLAKIGRSCNIGNKNGMWKGDKVGYVSLHEWIKNRLRKTELCQMCKEKPPYDLANISGKYLRDLTDWYWLCRKCHMLSDGRMEKFVEKGR